MVSRLHLGLMTISKQELFDSKEYKQAAELFKNKEWQGGKYEAGDFAAAIESLKGVQTPRGKYNLANAYAQNKDFDQAISFMNKY